MFCEMSSSPSISCSGVGWRLCLFLEIAFATGFAFGAGDALVCEPSLARLYAHAVSSVCKV
jgi:hypothetical protein